MKKRGISLNIHRSGIYLTLGFIVLLSSLGSARTSIISFPLKNERADKMYYWISAAFPELLSRSLFYNNDIQIYDPAFMFQSDSSVWEMKSDSLLDIHRSKWRWDLAVGGRFQVINDSLHLTFDVIWSADNQEPVRMEFREKGVVKDYHNIVTASLLKMLSLVHIQLSEEDVRRVKDKLTPYSDAFNTYIAGYYFEMRGNIPAALTAYSRSLEIDPQMVIAACRLGFLYTIQKKYVAAKELFERAMHKRSDDPMIIAFMADFLSGTESLDVAAQFIERYRTYLTMTSKGLSAAGSIYFRQGEYQRAIATLTQAVASGPENLDTDFLLGQAWLQTGDFQRAIEIFNRLIKCRPDYLRYYSSLGSAYRKSGQLMQAAMTLQSAYTKDPENVIVMIDLSQIWIELKWYEKALQLLKKAEAINPEIGDIYINTALVYWYTGKEAEAKEYLLKAYTIPDVRQSALINMGNIFFSKMDYRKAIDYYKKASKLGRQNSSIEYNTAIAYLELGKKRKAIVHFDALLALAPERIDILKTRANLAMDLGNMEDAEHYLRRLIEISPLDTRTVELMVQLYIRVEKYDEAIRTLEEFLAYTPLNKEFIVLLAHTYLTRGWFEVASEKFREIIRDFPNDAEGYLGLGMSMYELVVRKKNTKVDDALYTLKYASQYSPDNPLPDRLMGDLYSEYKGFRELAIDHWNKALNKTKNEMDRKILQKKIDSVK